MKNRFSHIVHLAGLTSALLALFCAIPSGMAQTPGGTKIFNQAAGRFQYKTGQQDSVHSNTTETDALQPLVVASSVSMTASPQALLGNGTDSSRVRATVLDASSNPVPDGTPVFFSASEGSFPGGGDTLTTFTSNGIATAVLRSGVVSQNVRTALVTASTAGINNVTLSTSIGIPITPGAFRGLILSGPARRPVQGAVIVVRDAAKSEIDRDTTDASGAYTVHVQGPGLYTRTISALNQFGDQVQSTVSYAIQDPLAGGNQGSPVLNALAGTVVDRSTGQPIREAGIQVTIQQTPGNISGPARLLAAARITNDRGGFVFDSLAPGTYTISVIHPQYAASATIADTLPETFTIDENLTAAGAPVLELVKTVNRRIAEVGDAVVYAIGLRNASTATPLTGIAVVDDLPVGFVYAPHSSRLDRKVVGDPAGGRRLVWTLPDTLQPGKEVRLTYMVTLGAGALDGQGINRARAIARDVAGDTVQSAESAVQVDVHPGVFTDLGLVIGKVFVDRNGDGVQDESDHGIAGVELWMEDGTHVLTGDDGKYSLPEVRPGQHVIRIDRRTLPAGAEVLANGSDFAGDGTSRFIRLTEGGIARADFPIAPPRQASIESGLVLPPEGMPDSSMTARYVIRWNENVTAYSIVLVDTLARGFHFDLRSLTAGDSVVAGKTSDPRFLHLEFRTGREGRIDSIAIAIRPDSTFERHQVIVRPRLILGYRMRREAVIDAPIVAVPGNVPQDQATRVEETR